MSGWMKDWGQFITLLLALGGFYGFIRSDMRAMEGRLGARIDANRAAIDTNRAAIDTNREAIVENGKAIARLEVRIQRVEDDVTWLRNNR